MPTKRFLALFLTILVISAGRASLTAAEPTPSTAPNAPVVNGPLWVFAGRLTRIQNHQAPIAPHSPASVEYTVVPGLILQGTPPKTLRVYGHRLLEPRVSNLYIFIVAPTSQVPGFDGILYDLRPYSTAELQKIKAQLKQL